MGQGTSKAMLATHEQLLKQLVGVAKTGAAEPFWEELLTFPVPLCKLAPADVEAFVFPFCEDLVLNNSKTQHFGTLVIKAMEVLADVPRDVRAMPLKAVNTVCFLGVLIKYFNERVRLEEIPLLFEAPPGAAEKDLLAAWVQTSLQYVADAAPTNETYLLMLQILNMLLVMCSTQLYAVASTSQGSHVFLDALVAQSSVAPAFAQKMLMLFIDRPPQPARLPLYKAESQGVLRIAYTAAGFVLLLPYHAFRYMARSNPARPSPDSLLADTALLLLLVLTHYSTGIEVDAPNPFRTALQACRDMDYDVADPEGNPVQGSAIRVPFPKLYDRLGECLVDDRATLLLYALIHGNEAFLEYVLVRSDLDTIVLPLMEMLYNAVQRTPNQIYMILIILLILSQDPSFNANIHKVIVQAVPWYKERLLTKVSLGSLVVILLIRTIKYNLAKLRDVYLHTNCLAVLANMAPHAVALNAYASQRLVSLFDMLARKYNRVSETSNGIEESAGDAPSDLQIYTDFLRIVLEIINSILTHALAKNPEVVYALLHRQELFAPFRTHPKFGELLDNIYTVLDFFNSGMDAADVKGEWSVDKVLNLVVKNAQSWTEERMKVMSDLKFTYEEEMHPEEFFIPYVWSLVCTHSGIMWDPQSITLFSAGEEPQAATEVEPSPGSGGGATA